MPDDDNPEPKKEAISFAMLVGTIVAVLLLSMIAIAVWLASTTGSAFELSLAAVVMLIVLAVLAGYFAASTSSILGFVTRWKQELAILFPKPADEDDLLRDTRRTRDAFVYIGLAGLAAMCIYALQWKPAGFARVYGGALMVALASVSGGIGLGFLFGIPRTLQGDQKPDPATKNGSATGDRLAANTNLEQISDWLTKIIVGLGLINLDKIPVKVSSFVSQIAPAVGGSFGFALSIVVGYGVCGFLLGYLLTRLYLTRAFVRADSAGRGIERAVEQVAAETATNPEAAQPSAESAPVSAQQKVAAVRVERLAKGGETDVHAQVIALAREYEAVRGSMPSGNERTHAMEVVASKMRAFSLACYDMLPTLTASTSPGQRLAAISFLEVKPSPEYLLWLAERLKIETPFVGYHAAWALRYAAQGLPLNALVAVKEAIATALAHLGNDQTSDRARTLLLAQMQLSQRMGG